MKRNCIISIGRNCLPRTIATRAGLQIRRDEGEISLPFDLAVSSYDSVCDLVDKDFIDFLNPQFLKLDPKNIIINLKYRFYFNHESINSRFIEFSQNNFSKLIQVYENRISNWEYKLKNHKKILFISNHLAFPSRFYSIIQKKYPDLKFRILALYTPRPHVGESEKHILEFYKNWQSNFPHIDYLFIPQPTEKYAWHKKEHYTHKLGISFEQIIASSICNSLDKLDQVLS